MKKLFFLIFILLLAGCSHVSESSAENLPEAEETDIPTELPENPGSFDLRYESWVVANSRNIMDTRTGILQKDLIENGAYTTSFTPTEAWKTELFACIRESGVCGITRKMTSEALTSTDEMIDVEPNENYLIEIWVDDAHYVIKGDVTSYYYQDDDEDARIFNEAIRYLNRTMQDLPEWQDMPEPEGGYE